MIRIEPAGPAVRVRLDRGLAGLLDSLPALLDGVTATDDPARARLNPDVHREDPEAQADYSRYMAGELDESRRSDRTALTRSLKRIGRDGRLSRSEARAWLRVINEARLTLAARAGLLDDAGPGAAIGPDRGDPVTSLIHVLAYIQELLLDALAADLE